MLLTPLNEKSFPLLGKYVLLTVDEYDSLYHYQAGNITPDGWKGFQVKDEQRRLYSTEVTGANQNMMNKRPNKKTHE